MRAPSIFPAAVGGQHCRVKWWQSIFIFRIKGRVWKRRVSCRAETIILDLFQQCHACASCWFLWCWYSVSDKVVKRLFLWQFCCHRTTNHLRQTCGVGSCFHSFHILGNYKEVKTAHTLTKYKPIPVLFQIVSQFPERNRYSYWF